MWYSINGETRNVSDLVGKILVSVKGCHAGSEQIEFVCEDGSRYVMYHERDCCESVEVDTVYGEVDYLIDEPIIIAEEAISENKGPVKESYDESYTWTFYKFATSKGYVDIRWYGSSNGWYSERVNFVFAGKEEKDEG